MAIAPLSNVRYEGRELTERVNYLLAIAAAGGVADPELATAALELFSTVTKGVVPPSDGNTAHFLRADGVWSQPPGEGGNTDLSYNSATRTLVSSTGLGTILPLIGAATAGLAPASGGGTENFLRADGSWARPTGAAFESLAELQAASPEEKTTSILGHAIVPDAYSPGSSTLVAANLRRFAPADGKLRLSMIASDAEMVSDAKGNILTLLEDAAGRGWEAYVSPPKDPDFYGYEADYIQHELTSDIRVTFDPRTIIYSKTSFQQFACNGIQKSFTITAWDYQGPSDEPLGVMVVAGGVDTGLDVGSGYSISAVSPGVWAVVTTSTYPTGTTLVVASSRGAFQFRCNDAGAGYTVYGHGGRFDLRRAGYVLAQASRSGLAFTNVPNIRWTGMIHSFGASTSDWTASSLNRRGDSGVTVLGHKTASFEHIRGDYLNDLAAYISGGGLSGRSDNGLWTHIGLIEAYRTSTGFKNSRQHPSLIVDAIHCIECRTGMIYGVTGSLDPTGSVQLGSIRGERMARRLLDIRDTTAPVTINSAIVRDIGYDPTGTIAETDSAAVFMSGARAVHIGYLGVTYDLWAPVTDAPAVWMSSNRNYGNVIASGFVEGSKVGIRETGSETNDTGNFIRLTLKDVTSGLDMPSTSDTEYDLTIMTESAGVITTSHKRRRGNRRTYDPTAYWSGMTIGALTHAAQEGTYVVDDYRRCTVSLQVQFTATHSSGGQELRITLPIEASTREGEAQTLPITHYNGLNHPGDDSNMVLEIPSGASYGRIRCWYDDGSIDGNSITLTTANVTNGASVRLYVTGTYFAVV